MNIDYTRHLVGNNAYELGFRHGFNGDRRHHITNYTETDDRDQYLDGYEAGLQAYEDLD